MPPSTMVNSRGASSEAGVRVEFPAPARRRRMPRAADPSAARWRRRLPPWERTPGPGRQYSSCARQDSLLPSAPEPAPPPGWSPPRVDFPRRQPAWPPSALDAPGRTTRHRPRAATGSTYTATAGASRAGPATPTSQAAYACLSHDHHSRVERFLDHPLRRSAARSVVGLYAIAIARSYSFHYPRSIRRGAWPRNTSRGTLVSAAKRAPGSVKLRAGGDSPRPGRRLSPAAG